MASGEELRTAPQHYRDTFNRKSHSQFELSMASLRTFEERLADTNAGLVGEEVTYADLALFLQLWELIEEDQLPLAFTALHLPNLSKFVHMIGGLKQVRTAL